MVWYRVCLHKSTALPVFGKHGELTNWYQAGRDFIVGWSQTGFSGRSGKGFDPLR